MEHLYRSPKYKGTTTSRGLKYHYYFSPAVSKKPTLLFVHGFPSFSAHWINQITFFEKEGFGLVVPDMLGYGGSSIPKEPEAYVHALQAKDLIDIIDEEKLGSNVVAVGHDWGSVTVSRVANLYQDRFLGFAFLSVGYLPPSTETTYEELRNQWAAALGYVNIGYWEFFASPEAADIMTRHTRAYNDLGWAQSTGMIKYNFCPVGGVQNFIESESSTPRATYLSKEDMITTEKLLARGGWSGPLSYYRNEITDASREADKAIPAENYTIHKPVLFIGTAHDPIVVPALMEPLIQQFCTNSATTTVEAAHWAFWEAPEQVNAQLYQWLKRL